MPDIYFRANDVEYVIVERGWISKDPYTICSSSYKIGRKTLKTVDEVGWKILFFPPLYQNLSVNHVKFAGKTLGLVKILKKGSSFLRIIFTTWKCGEGIVSLKKEEPCKNFEKCIGFALIIIRDYLNLFLQFVGLFNRYITLDILVVFIFLRIIAVVSFIKEVMDLKKSIVSLIRMKKYCKMVVGPSKMSVENVLDGDIIKGIDEDFMPAAAKERFEVWRRQKIIKKIIRLFSCIFDILFTFILVISYFAGNKIFKNICYYVITFVETVMEGFYWIFPLFIKYDLKKREFLESSSF